MWPDRKAAIQGIIDDMTARAAKHGRTLRFGYRAHVIVRDSEAEARLAADRLLSKLDAATGAAIRGEIARFAIGRRAGTGGAARDGRRRGLCRG